MRNSLIAALAGFLLGCVSAGLTPLLPWPFSTLDLPLATVLILSWGFRQREAIALAAGAGLALDAVSPFRFGTMTVLFAAAAWIIVILMTEVLTHVSPAAMLGSSVAAAVLWLLLLGGITAAYDRMAGVASAHALPSISTIATAGAMQAVLAVGAYALIDRFGRAWRRIFFA